jgi:hypothetical protein
MTLISNLIDDAKPYCVYYHLIDQTVFYIGSGVLSRAFDHGSARRNEAWNAYAARRPVSINIVGQYADRATARRDEYAAIKKHRPIANLPYDAAVGLDFQVTQGDGIPWLVATDAYVGMHIRMTDEAGRFQGCFGSLQLASDMTGVSKSAISNSISGRYPIVSGKRFIREPRPARDRLLTAEESRSLAEAQNRTDWLQPPASVR